MAGPNASAEAAVRIDVVSDVVCPWCFVGKRRLEQALQLTPDLTTTVYWRPFQLDGTVPKGGIARADYLNRKFGADRAKDMYGRLERIGEEVGIAFAFDRIKTQPNTLDAHRLLRWAQDVGTQSAVKERLLTLFFLEGADIGDPEILADVGAANGLDRATTLRLLGSATDEAEVREEVASIQRMGINGVPFFIFNNRVGASGAQPAETLVQGMRQSLASEEDRSA